MNNLCGIILVVKMCAESLVPQGSLLAPILAIYLWINFTEGLTPQANISLSSKHVNNDSICETIKQLLMNPFVR